ncbi:MAG: beta strand repeat-containing protein [Chthoniobacteraceae bacterium]
MKTPYHSTSSPRCARSLATALATVIWLPLQASAANLYWDTTTNNGQIDANSGTWDTTTSNTVWTSSSTGAVNTGTSWTSGTGVQAVFGGVSAAPGTYVITVSSAGIQAQTLRFFSSGYIFTALTSTTIGLGYGAGANTGSGFNLDPGVTVNVGDNITVVSGTGSSQALTFTGSGTTIISASSPSATATVRAGKNNNTNIAGGATVVVGTNGVLQTGLTINGGLSNGSLVIGNDASNATLTIDGGTVNFGNLVMGNGASTGVSTLNVESGTAVTLNSGSGVLRFGSTSTAATSGTSIVNLDGGTLSVCAITVGTSTSVAHYAINFNGGTLQVAGTSSSVSTFLASASQITASVMGKGAVIDTNGYNATIAQALVSGTANDGGLTKLGQGTLTVTGANTYTGATTVKSGSLAVGVSGDISKTLVLGGSAGSSSGTLDVSLKGSAYSLDSISGNGSIVGATGSTIISTVSVAPGVGVGDIGKLNVSSNFTLASTASTLMEISGIGGVDGTDYDYINVDGVLTYGGSLVINSVDGYDLTQAGSYDLFDLNSKSSDFSSVTVNGVTLTLTSGTWTSASGQYTFDESSGVLSVTAVPEPSVYAALVGGLGVLGLLRRKGRA